MAAALDALLTVFPPILTQKWEELRIEAQALKPPNGNVMPVSDALSGICGVLWTISYILLTVRAFKDKSYGMPIFALCINICVEFLYGFVYPPDPYNSVIFAVWAIADVFLFAATARYGRHEWRHAPLVANNLVPILAICVSFALWAQLALASELIPTIGRQVVWHNSNLAQIVLSAGGVIQLLSRHHTKGHSVHIWWTRFVGTQAANVAFFYRAMEWPSRFGYAWEPLSRFYMIFGTFLDVAYIFVFLAVRKYEQRQEKAVPETKKRK